MSEHLRSKPRRFLRLTIATSLLAAFFIALFFSLPPTRSTAFGQAATAVPTPFPRVCPDSLSPQNFRTITFDNKCSYPIWVGASGAGVPASMAVPPGDRLAELTGTETWCIPSPCPSCAYFPATNCTGSGDNVACDTGLKRLPPLTAVELAQGGTKGAPPNPIVLALPSPLPSPYVHFLGNGWIQPGSFFLYSDTAEMVEIAKDTGDGNVSGTAINAGGTIDYVGGIVSLPFNSTVGSNIYAKFSHVGTDLYDVSMVDGFNLPIEVSPTRGTIPNASEVGYKPQPCVIDANCDQGFTCSADTHQCIKTCTEDKDCGQWPNRCDKNLTPNICVNSINTAYWCTSPGNTGDRLRPPGCLPGDTLCSNQTACNWDFGSNKQGVPDLSKCPASLKVTNGAGMVVGCTTPVDACDPLFATGGIATGAKCTAPSIGEQGTCPSGTVCNGTAAQPGICFPTEACTGGPGQKGTCPNEGQICSSAEKGICLDSYHLPDGCMGGPGAPGNCPEGLTCSAAMGGKCECNAASASKCPTGTVCSSNDATFGVCIGCQGHCSDAAKCLGQGVCAGSCSGAGRGNCPADLLCSPPGGPAAGGCLAGPSQAFKDLECLGNYKINCSGANKTCPPTMACDMETDTCVSSNLCNKGKSCTTILDCPQDGKVYQCVGESGDKFCYSGCPAGDFSVCDPHTNRCQPSNTGLYGAKGPAELSCQIVSGTYNSCFSEEDCFPGTKCDLVAGDPNQFTCIDSSANADAYNCKNVPMPPPYPCPGQNSTTNPGTCGAPPVGWPTRDDKCLAIGGHACSSNANCPAAGGSGQQMICREGECMWPDWCGGPLNERWRDVNMRAGNYQEIFKKACPTTYPYQYDDPTASFQCQQSAVGFTDSASNNMNVASLGYTVTFCPPVPAATPTATHTPSHTPTPAATSTHTPIVIPTH